MTRQLVSNRNADTDSGTTARLLRGRFGLRGFLVFVTAMCIGLMAYLYIDERRRQTRVDRWVKEHSGQTNYDFQINRDGTISYGGPPKPSYFEELIFDNFMQANIVDVYLPDSRIVNIDPLRGMGRLEKLDLSGTSITDLSPLNGNRRLWYLNLTQGKVDNVRSLRNCYGLRYLSLFRTMVSDIEPLSALTQMRYLSIEGTPVRDIKPIAEMKQLEELYLARTNVSNIDVVEGLVQLKSLSLNDTRVKNIQPLQNLTNLKELWLNDTGVAPEDVRILQSRLPDCEIYF